MMLPIAGTWHFTVIELWDDDYVNMERQAFVEIGADDIGAFQFGLVRGQLHGNVETLEDAFGQVSEGEPARQRSAGTPLPVTRFVFTWDGFDELDEVSGGGWMRLVGADEAVGVIKIHLGDHSTFRARRDGRAPARPSR